MGISISVDGAEAAAGVLEGFSEELKEKISKGLEKGCKIVEASAKAMAPVDTGRLRASITSEVEGLSGRVGTNVEYGIYQEFGTYKMAAQPFLVPALLGNESSVIAAIAEAVGG